MKVSKGKFGRWLYREIEHPVHVLLVLILTVFLGACQTVPERIPTDCGQRWNQDEWDSLAAMGRTIDIMLVLYPEEVSLEPAYLAIGNTLKNCFPEEWED